MWLPDPYQLIEEPTLEGEDEEPEELPPTPDEIFHQQFHHRPDDTSYHLGFHVDVCRFDGRGNHTSIAQNCPHFDQIDEEGPRIKANWTVQQNTK